MVRFIEQSSGVFVTTEPVVCVTESDIGFLREQAASSLRRRARLCLHANEDDPVHEMIIVVRADSYVRPHRHRNKSESFHLISGRIDVVLFDEGGAIRDVVELGMTPSTQALIYRMNVSHYHSVIVRSAEAVLHETTRGPWRSGDSEYAAWAPADSDDPRSQAASLAELRKRVDAFLCDRRSS